MNGGSWELFSGKKNIPLVLNLIKILSGRFYRSEVLFLVKICEDITTACLKPNHTQLRYEELHIHIFAHSLRLLKTH